MCQGGVPVVCVGPGRMVNVLPLVLLGYSRMCGNCGYGKRSPGGSFGGGTVIFRKERTQLARYHRGNRPLWENLLTAGLTGHRDTLPCVRDSPRPHRRSRPSSLGIITRKLRNSPGIIFSSGRNGQNGPRTPLSQALSDEKRSSQWIGKSW